MRARVSSENSSTRSLPESLAWYIAVSASRSSSSASTSSVARHAAADAHAHVAALAGHVERGAEGAAEAARGDRRAHLVGADAQDHELVAAHAGHDVALVDGAAQALGDLDQEPVAGLVTEAVVDDLEIVEVEEEDGQAVGGEQRGAQLGHEGGSIGEAREGVEPGDGVEDKGGQDSLINSAGPRWN